MTDENDSRWDIPAGKRPDFQTDLKYGKRGENLVKDFIASLVEGSFEVKSDRFRNGRMVVELEQNPRGKGWKPSGLAVCLATWWVYCFALEGAFVVVSCDRLKRFVATLPVKRMKTFAPLSNNPTRGYLLEPEEVNLMMCSTEYDA